MNDAIAYRHLASRAFDTPLLMEPSKLSTICDLVLVPRILGLEEEAEIRADSRVTLARRREGLRIVDGVAVIDIIGTLVHRLSWLDALSGLTSYEEIEAEFDTAMASRDVRGILLRVDSPGGEVSGAFDLADRIRSQMEASSKPVFAIAEDLAASAAYLLASSAEQLFVTQTGFIGSVGVVLARLDRSQKTSITQVFAGRRKLDFNADAPLTDERKSALQEIVDEIYGHFVAKVAANRGVSEDQVRDTEAAIYVGQIGVDYGLADGVATLESARAALTAEIEERQIARTLAMVGGSDMPAIPRHRSSTSDASWDGPANEARLRNDESESYYRRAYAWQDPDGNPDAKSGYSFIHHEVAQGGDIGAANLTACSNAIGILNGGRGGGPDAKWWSDRRGIYNHVAGHLRDAGREPPPLKSEAQTEEETTMAETSDKVTIDTAGSEAAKKDEKDEKDQKADPTASAGVVDAAEKKEGADAQAAVQAERTRIAELEAVCPPGQEKLLARAKAEGWSKGDFAVAVLEAQKSTRKARLDSLKGDEEALEDIEPLGGGGADGVVDDEKREVQRTLAAYYGTLGREPKPNGREIPTR